MLKKTSNIIKIWAVGLNRHFSQQDIQMANMHMKSFSTSLIIREVKVQTTRYHFTSVREAITKKIRNSKC